MILLLLSLIRLLKKYNFPSTIICFVTNMHIGSVCILPLWGRMQFCFKTHVNIWIAFALYIFNIIDPVLSYESIWFLEWKKLSWTLVISFTGLLHGKKNDPYTDIALSSVRCIKNLILDRNPILYFPYKPNRTPLPHIDNIFQ